MAMNIKNEHVHALAREAARRTGRSQTSVMEEALEAFVRRLDEADGALERERDRRHDRTREILAEVDALLTDEDRAAMCRAAGDLYDDRGLPAW